MQVAYYQASVTADGEDVVVRMNRATADGLASKIETEQVWRVFDDCLEEVEDSNPVAIELAAELRTVAP